MTKDESEYVGRFAPSPSGPLHLGSLYIALASYLDAKASAGRWLLRIEDIDHFRCDSQYHDVILRSLEQFGLLWDGEVAIQSQRLDEYQAAFDRLVADDRVYYCACTRKQLKPFSGVYPGFCRSKGLISSEETSARVRIENKAIGDVLIRRKDGQFAYQLVVVVDDALQGVTHIIRGNDLLSSRPGQLSIQALLGYPKPQYRHFPVLVDRMGIKLSKQTGARSVADFPVLATLCWLLEALGLPDVRMRDFDSVSEVLRWAVQHWPAVDRSQLDSLQLSSLQDNSIVADWPPLHS